METLLQKIKDFNKQQIGTYKRDNTLEIKFGKITSGEIFSLKLKDTLDLVKNFRNYKLSYSQGKVYKYKDGYYKTFNNKNNISKKVDLLEKEMFIYDKYDLLIVNNLVKDLGYFPSKKEYHDEYEYDEINIYIDKNMVLTFETYNDMFFIKIVIDLEKDLPYTYQDEVIENLKTVFELLEGLETL
jgi:hypothetical protein